MKTGIRGAFVIAWSQVELDGMASAPADSLAIGSTWLWRGGAVRIDGPSDVLVLGGAAGADALRRHAARAVDKVIGRTRPEAAVAPALDEDAPVLERGFSLTDGRRRYNATLIDRADGPPLCLFLDDLPPGNRELWVSHAFSGPDRRRGAGEEPSVICFTPDALIETPTGRCPVRDLEEGDLVQTRDDGPQPIRWIGWRRMSGARLYAMPALRPIRIGAGAIGSGSPDPDLLVSPGHRLLIRGALAQGLFNTDEVLVAAQDLINDRTIRVDRRRREVTYVHLMLDRHGIVIANGVETESFHPATMDLTAMDPAQAARLEARVPGVSAAPGLYGAFARRMLSRSEAAILRHAAGRAH